MKILKIKFQQFNQILRSLKTILWKFKIKIERDLYQMELHLLISDKMDSNKMMNNNKQLIYEKN